jgi:hypothetical protein
VIRRGVVIFAFGVLAGCHPQPAVSSGSEQDLARYKGLHPDTPETTAVPPYEYYTGSDAESDYYVILDGPGGKQHPFASDRDSKAWPNPMPRTQDQTQWRLVPGSSGM